jgi:hypothetical protein
VHFKTIEGKAIIIVCVVNRRHRLTDHQSKKERGNNMRYLTVFVTTLFLIFTITISDANAQELVPGETLPELSSEQIAERGMVNSLALAEALILYAEKQGQSAAEVGRFAGELFAESWPDEFTPEFFVNAMNSNWQMFGVSTKIIDADEARISARRDRIATEEQFAQIFQVSLSDIETFFEHVLKGIISPHGLRYSENVEGDYIEFTISK